MTFNSAQLLTRSVGVICLSRYLQHLTMTGYKTLKNHIHLITFIIVTRSLNQPHPTLQIPRHTRRPTGTLPYSTTGTINRWIAPGNANSLNCRAVIANTQSVNIVSTMTILRYTATANLAHLLLRDTQPNAHAKAKEPNTITFSNLILTPIYKTE